MSTERDQRIVSMIEKLLERGLELCFFRHEPTGHIVATTNKPGEIVASAYSKEFSNLEKTLKDITEQVNEYEEKQE